MKLVKKVFLFLITLVLLTSSSVSAFALDTEPSYADKKHPYMDYYFESYDVSINVLENNTLEITEKISAYFNVEKHGIFRKIPTTNSVERADGSKGVTNAKVKNLSVSDNYDSYTEGNYYVVQVGDESRTVLGPHDYLISYSYVMGKDIGEGFDELYFNIIGAFIFMLAFYGLNQIIHFSFFNEPVTAFNVAILHSLFNVTCTLVLLPFTKHLERLVCFSIKDKEEKKNAALPNLLDERLLVTPGVAIDAADKVTLEMGILGRENLDLAFEVLQKYDSKKSDLMEENENRVDGYEDKLGSYLIRLSERSLSQQDNRQISKLLHTITDFERISDHTCNLLNSATELHEKKISFSEPAMQDLLVLRQAISEILDLTLNCFASEDLADAIQVEPLEEVIDEICINVKNRHIDRMQRGLCSLEKGFIFQDVLTNLERMSDHCSNIAACIIELQHNSFDTHKYLNELRSSGNQSYKNLQKYYREAYKLPELPKL